MGLIFLAAPAWASGVTLKPETRVQIEGDSTLHRYNLARPINAPFATRKEWQRYVKRMHVRQKVRDQEGFFKEEGKAIVDFLVYDAQARKVKDKAAFHVRDKDLMALFDEVQKERGRLQIKKSKEKVKDVPPGDTGVHPYPKPK